jgi:hypothetical protein
MSSFFPLPPNIKIKGLDKRVEGSLDFINFPNNLQKKNLFKIDKREIYLGIYKITNQKWRLLKVERCLYKEFIEIERIKLSVSDSEMVIIIIRRSNDFPDECESLPEPLTLRVDNSTVNERASFNLRFNNFVSSYQGEYPLGMASIFKSTFFSFDALKSETSSRVKNFLLLMNVKRNAFSQELRKVKIYDPLNKNIIHELFARENLISIHELCFLEKYQSIKKVNFLSCNNCVFIPLLFSIDLITNQLSLEHTHPPIEMLWGEERNQAVNFIKKKWVL